MKSHKLVSIFFAVWLLLFIMGCPTDVSQTTKTPKSLVSDKVESKKVTKNKVENEKIATKIDCNKKNEYSFVVVENPNRGDNVSNIPKDLNIVIGEEIVAKIELPIADSEAKNFRMNSAKKTKEGFEIKADWGGGIYHYKIQYSFRCKENNFYLYKVKNENYFTKDTSSGNFLDEKETKITKIEPNIPIEKIVMINYL